MNSLRDRVTDALTAAMRDRDRDAVAVHRRLLAAFSNAEAVPTAARAGAIEEAALVGSADVEVSREAVTEDDLGCIATAELDELRGAADEAAALGAVDEADRLRRQADIVTALLAG